LYGDGFQRWEFTYVDDIVAATLAAAELTAAVINVGGGSSVTMLDLLDLAHHVTGRPVPVVPADRQAGDVAATEADLTRAHQLLCYRPSLELRDGVARHADWLARLAEPLRTPLLPHHLLEVSR
jgi:nucleoside-diphosphate-sugar epimerase